MDARNAVYYEAWRGRPVAEVQRESREAFDLLRGTIERTPEELLNETERFAWLNGSAVWQMIPGNSYEHYQDHIPSIRVWLGGQGT
jgi:hypothetical protein